MMLITFESSDKTCSEKKKKLVSISSHEKIKQINQYLTAPTSQCFTNV